MDVVTIPPEVKEAWAFTEALRRLGFGADSIFTVIGQNEGDPLQILLRQGINNFVINAAIMSVPPKDCAKAWNSFVDAVNKNVISDSSLVEIYENSTVGQSSSTLVLSLLQKGIQIPKLSPKETKNNESIS